MSVLDSLAVMDKKKLVVLSGSGISAESGLATFRGGSGLWNNVPVEKICTTQAWNTDPERVTEFYNELRAQLEKAEPNEAHKLLVQLQDRFDVRVITQNVDNLHERAGSRDVLHLHGELTKVRPDDCYTDWDGYSMKHVIDVGYRPVRMGETGGPRSRQLRPHIVFFGEAVPNLQKAIEIVSQADILLVIGTSLQVYPAAMLHTYAPSGCKIFMIDPDENPAASIHGVTHICKVATDGMREFCALL